MARGHAGPVHAQSPQDERIDGSIETRFQLSAVYGGISGVESERAYIRPLAHPRSDAVREDRRRV